MTNSVQKMTYVYILRSVRCADKTYVGVSTNFEQRVREHNQGKSKHTSKFIPWRVEYYETYLTLSQAIKREKQLKRWSKAKKEALIAGDTEKLIKLSKRSRK